MKTLLFRRVRPRDAWPFFFILGLVILNYPFITIFDKGVLLWGIPLLFLYLYLGWGGFILLIYLFVRDVDRAGRDTDPGTGR